MSIVPEKERQQLIRDKYGSATSVDPTELAHDLARLADGEPLAYVIGWQPFLGLSIDLTGRPLIPRPETEAWTLELIEHLKKRFGSEEPLRVLDLCAGSGAIGLAVLARLPQAEVWFAEIDPAHVTTIKTNIARNGLDAARAHIVRGNLFTPLHEERFDVIATNPPYIPEARVLEPSVSDYEPARALFAGADGLDLIRRIAREAPSHLLPKGELWMECDSENIEEARELVRAGDLPRLPGAHTTEIRIDPYGRARVCVGYYS